MCFYFYIIKKKLKNCFWAFPACTDFSFYVPLKDRLRGAILRDATGCHGLSREIHRQGGCYSGQHITVRKIGKK
jgi:hypothetical protein